ncbi:hypothetical protein [Pantanalinema sp. GBBB05]|uniref:hypothetical protein n=1 Tax=Pantanalinema sp. GBBB05 TaxID=2604139 RepID=UPI001D631AC2|nr:hypothetical protein [Pantanalinema sp. GBBB05]
MKNIALACITSLAIAAPAFARCDDNVSYMVDRNGRCIDLTGITTVGALAAQRESMVREASPIALENLKFHQDDSTKRVYIQGMAVNRSSSPVNVNAARINLSKMRDGKRVDIGVETVAIGEMLMPGERLGFSQRINRPREEWWSTDLSAGRIDFEN